MIEMGIAFLAGTAVICMWLATGYLGRIANALQRTAKALEEHERGTK